ncbi:hypothetical protein EDC94DRAFT_603159 [Helicostylum pulchrum]|uniref:Uncharacterized protein n=1 Tax=Helicostylum pulchrum TaxID=562976 RepID=A0ABP9YFN8_9FUNG|nr:hypothetical protein EDC94DRAFT_603159 [Helicostylum pulchrum]
MNSLEFNLIDRIITCSPNKIYSSHRAKREIPLRKVVLASRALDIARSEQNRLLMEEADNIRLIRQNQGDGWWLTNSLTMPDPETPSALLDTNLLLDTGIIDFESSPLFTAPPASPSPLLDNLIDFNNQDTFDANSTTAATATTTATNNDLLDIGDWSWLKEDKILEPISSNALLSHNNYDEEEEESESEEDEFVVVLVNNTIPLQDSKWITLIPPPQQQQKKEKRSLELDHEEEEPPSNKRIRT